MCGYAVAQSTKQSNPPQSQPSPESQGGSHTDNVRNGDQHPSNTTVPSTEISISDQPQALRKEEQPKADAEGGKGDNQYLDWLNAISAAVIALFTGLLWRISKRQTTLMDNQTQALENQTKLMASQDRLIKNSERAFIFVNSINCTFNPNQIAGDIQWTIHVSFENFGNTPAKNMQVYTTLETTDDPLPDDFPFNESGNLNVRTLGPRGVAITTVGTTGEKLHQVKIGKKHMYIWGWAKYSDILEGSATHVTTFCHKIIVNGDPRNTSRVGDKIESASLGFENHKNHNDAN